MAEGELRLQVPLPPPTWKSPAEALNAVSQHPPPWPRSPSTSHQEQIWELQRKQASPFRKHCGETQTASKAMEATLPCVIWGRSVLLFPAGSNGNKSVCNAGDPGAILGLGKCPGEGNGMTTHSSILAWRIPWTKKPGGLQSMGSLRVRHDWATNMLLSQEAWVEPSRAGPLKSWSHLSCSDFWGSMVKDLDRKSPSSYSLALVGNTAVPRRAISGRDQQPCLSMSRSYPPWHPPSGPGSPQRPAAFQLSNSGSRAGLPLHQHQPRTPYCGWAAPGELSMVTLPYVWRTWGPRLELKQRPIIQANKRHKGYPRSPKFR